MAALQNAGRRWYQAWNSWLALLPLTALLLLSGAVKPTACDVDPALDQLYRRFYTNREGYKYARPVANVSEPVIMYMNLSLVQLMNVDEKNQIISLNLWVYQEWHDPFFRWDPGEYGGISKIILPSDGLWTPDVVLYSNTGTNWDLSATSTRVKVNNKGLVVWKPPITYDSSCDINVEFFPFDTQDCKLKMGTWTYHGLHIDMRHVAQKADDNGRNRRNFDNCESDIDYAIDLADYVESAEWDLMRVSATRNIVKYACCVEPYLDITFLVTFRRQPLFYGTNLIAPCIANTEEEWKYIALILDRIFLYCFGLSSVVGMLGIFLQAPTLTDNKDPLRASKFLEYESNINFTRRCGVGYQATS